MEVRSNLIFSKCTEEIKLLENFNSDLTILCANIIENLNIEKAKESLVILRFYNSLLDFKDVILLLMNKHSTSIIQILRYYLESLIQAYYLDYEHPNFNIENKLCILTEISNKREYFISRLLENVKLRNKDIVKKMYKELSSYTHPTHLDFPKIDEMLEKIEKTSIEVDCGEIHKLIELIISVYDIIFSLVIVLNKYLIEELKNKPEIKDIVLQHKMVSIKKILRINDRR